MSAQVAPQKPKSLSANSKLSFLFRGDATSSSVVAVAAFMYQRVLPGFLLRRHVVPGNASAAIPEARAADSGLRSQFVDGPCPAIRHEALCLVRMKMGSP